MRSILAFTTVTCLVALPVNAQQWGAEQREVIDHVQQCWEAWQDGFEAWRRACPHAEDRVWWYTAENVPKTAWGDFAESAQFFMDSEETLIFEHRPLHVGIHGDVATYAYWVFYAARDGSGQVNTYTQKRLETFRRVRGRWIFVAGMGVPEGQ